MIEHAISVFRSSSSSFYNTGPATSRLARNPVTCVSLRGEVSAM
jgi:hypothetical protein